MENEDVNSLLASFNSDSENKNNESQDTENGPIRNESQHNGHGDDKETIERNKMGLREGDSGAADLHSLLETRSNKYLVDNSSNLQVDLELSETQDMISLPTPCNSISNYENKNNEAHVTYNGPIRDESQDSQHNGHGDYKYIIGRNNMGFREGDIGGMNLHLLPETDSNKSLVDNSSIMQVDVELTETENMISLPSPCNSNSENENSEAQGTDNGPIREEADDKDITKRNNMRCREKGDTGVTDLHSLPETDSYKALVDYSSSMQVDVELTETVAIVEKSYGSTSVVHVEYDSSVVQHKIPTLNETVDDTLITGVKRARMTYDEQQPSVLVKYESLTRSSKRKLEELLQQWSQWHAQHSSLQDSNEELESGEETYFPALCIGLEKTSAVSFWIDDQKRKEDDGFISLDSSSVPVYDRGYGFSLSSSDGPSNMEGAVEIKHDDSRCFNCESYSHSLKECTKPRNNIAVNKARRNHKSKRNQNSSSKTPSRYYKDPPVGKYDGLRPGELDTETRHLLGLADLDPPPWLNRMRELGYPPGYLDDDDDQPSGITIFGDEEVVKEETEDGEILETDINRDPPKKMSVEFPGINAPIPENADEERWANTDPFRSRSHHQVNSSLEPVNKGRHYHEQRWSSRYRDDDDDDGPPGVELGSSYPPRYSNYDHSSYTSYSHRDNNMRSSSTYERSLTERGRRNPIVYDDFAAHNSYSSSSRHKSSGEYGSSRFEDDNDEDQNEDSIACTNRKKDENDSWHRRHSLW